jgi:hypothetical protein
LRFPYCDAMRVFGGNPQTHPTPSGRGEACTIAYFEAFVKL